ncbi:11534_t:CDS:2, partial [Cetraspora pellucida]
MPRKSRYCNRTTRSSTNTPLFEALELEESIREVELWQERTTDGAQRNWELGSRYERVLTERNRLRARVEDLEESL